MKSNVFIYIINALILTCFISNPSYAGESPYNEEVLMENIIHKKDDKGNPLQEKVTSDKFGNAEGSEFDLAKDGAFEGYTIALLHLYTEENFDFSLPSAALEEKGFSIVRWADIPPSPEMLESTLKDASQLLIIYDRIRKLNDTHLKVIKAFFDSGKGVYIWGDNEPYYNDANYVAQALFGTSMYGNISGNQIVGLKTANSRGGLIPKHMITTGLEYVYEGITIATIQLNEHLNPLIYGSANNVVAAIYDKEGKRGILDGGFTRLFIKWDTAGTGRYIKNAAAWLVNYERFIKRRTNKILSFEAVAIDGIPLKGRCLVTALLAEMGYFTQEINTSDIKDVKTALSAFQKDIGASQQNGQLDETTWKKLSTIKLSTKIKNKLRTLKCR